MKTYDEIEELKDKIKSLLQDALSNEAGTELRDSDPWIEQTIAYIEDYLLENMVDLAATEIEENEA